jgi:LTXXQ motif family protein
MNAKQLLAALVLGTAPLAAQQPAPPIGHMTGDPMAMQEMMGPMTQVMLYDPQHLLARKDALGLTGDQVGRLTTLRDASRAVQQAAMSEAKAQMQELQQAVSASAPDTSVLKAHFQAAHAAMGKAHWMALASAVQAKGILTDAQRTGLNVWVDSMQAWMQQHRHMMKPTESH